MKTLRDTNNNNSNTTNNPTQTHFSSNTSSTTTRHNFITTNESIYQNSNIVDSDATQNHRLQPQTIWRANNGITIREILSRIFTERRIDFEYIL